MFSDHSSTALFLILIIVVGGLGQHKEQPLAYLWTIPTTDTTCCTESRVTNYGPLSTWHPLPICWLLCSASRARGGMELGTQLRRLLSKWLWNKQVFICSRNDLNYTQQEISAWMDLTRKLKSESGHFSFRLEKFIKYFALWLRLLESIETVVLEATEGKQTNNSIYGWPLWIMHFAPPIFWIQESLRFNPSNTGCWRK